MISSPLSAQGITNQSLLTPETKKRLVQLHQTVDVMVGSVFYGAMLKGARNNPLKGQYGHGGRGEEVFMAQLHQTLAERAGKAHSSSLNEAIYRRLAAATARQTKDKVST